MAKRKVEPTEQILQSAQGELADIIKRAKSVNNFDSSLQELLPKALQPHCKVANFNNGNLMLYVDSGAIASKFHFIKPSLLSDLRKHPGFAGLASIEVKISQEAFKTTQIDTKVVEKHFSSEVSQQLIELIANTEDHDIKKSLEHLLRHKNQ